MMSVVEKVILLQGVDFFEHITTENLAHLAAIADPKMVQPGEVIYREGDVSGAMYVVVHGEVQLSREGRSVTRAGPGEAFGAWALFDDELRVVTATVEEDSELLVIEREDFIDLLADHVQITQGIIKSVVTRLRSLMEMVQRQ